MTPFYAVALLTVFAGAMGSSMAQAQTELIHTREKFSFLVNASYEETFPLFGAYEERKWAAGFDPQFVFPPSPHDQQGMVFTTVQDGEKRFWVNTALDRATGHAQYVYFIPATLIALIDVQLTREGDRATKVDVSYERTALMPEANQNVIEMAAADANAGPHWAAMINGYFANHRASKR
jgi:hypothetical protein